MPKPLDALSLALIERLQAEFPICANPFAPIAAELGVSEAEIIATIQNLLDNKVLTRFGPLYQIERAGGAFVLAAMAVPPERFAEVTARVNAFPQVAHNYRRTHTFNMWFVLATETPAGIAQTRAEIEAATGIAVHLFPKEKEFFVEMKLPPKLPTQGHPQ